MNKKMEADIEGSGFRGVELGIQGLGLVSGVGLWFQGLVFRV